MTKPRSLVLFIEGLNLDGLEVISLSGIEEVNRLYDLKVDFATSATDELEEELLQRPLTVSMFGGRSSGVARSFHGIVASVEVLGVERRGRSAYRLRIVPKMWLLKRRRTRRIWTDMCSLDIGAKLFAEHGVTHRTVLARELPKRPYCVQYDETDYAFLARLFAEDGLFFSFDHPPEVDENSTTRRCEVVVISDAPDSYLPIDGGAELRFARAPAAGAMEAREDHVTHFAPRTSIRSSGARVRGYDHRRPTSELRTEALSNVNGLAATGTAPAISPEQDLFTVSIFQGSYEGTVPVPPPGMTAPTVPADATRLLDSLRSQARTIEGASFCRRLMPGRKLLLVGHEHPVLDGGYVVTRIEHEAYEADVAPAGPGVRFISAGSSARLRLCPYDRVRPLVDRVGRARQPSWLARPDRKSTLTISAAYA